jgi:hypothetical protein
MMEAPHWVCTVHVETNICQNTVLLSHFLCHVIHLQNDISAYGTGDDHGNEYFPSRIQREKLDK